MKSIFAALVVITFTWPLSHKNEAPRYTIWNVGQGSWATAISLYSCYHFDMGGENAPWEAILAQCQDKENQVFFSHWDWDHISFVKRYSLKVKKLCIGASPRGKAKTSRKRQLKNIAICPKNENPSPFLWKELPYDPFTYQSYDKTTPNETSRIFIWKDFILNTGDSTKKDERRWLPLLSDAASVKWLLLGHHGSHTSTSKQLLVKLKNLRGSITSSRKKRYGHPHKKVVELLQRHQIPLISTEDWGNIHLME